MKTCIWGGDTFIGLLSQLVTVAPWHPSCVSSLSAVSGALRTGLIVASESAVRRWVTAGKELQPGH